jgi:hypothetical protein
MEVVIFRMDRSRTARGRGMYEIVTRIVTSIVTGIGGIGGTRVPGIPSPATSRRGGDSAWWCRRPEAMGRKGGTGCEPCHRPMRFR